MTTPPADELPLWPDEHVRAVVDGVVPGAAALRLAGLDSDRSAIRPASPVQVCATDQRLLVRTERGGIDWQVQLPRLTVELAGLPGRLVLWSDDRFVAIDLSSGQDVGLLLSALAG
ncbi:MAG: hypothetical protein AAGA99_04585 [Actinomycetota bacterium]